MNLRRHYPGVTFGPGVQVLGVKNVTIGRGSVVGANSVVTRDVPPFSVVVGNPAKIVKMYDPVCEIWMPIRTPKDQNRVLKNRQKKPFLSREAYRKILHAHGFKQVDPIVAGGERHP